MNQETVDSLLAEEIKKAISSSCRMLAIREHSKKQIHDKLTLKGFSLPAIKSTLCYLVDENWLCEERFCEAFIRSKSNKGQGLLRIEAELRQQNICQSLIDKALSEELIDWQKICEQTLLKKIRVLGWARLGSVRQDFKERVKLEKFLNYRGFFPNEIKIAIDRHLA